MNRFRLIVDDQLTQWYEETSRTVIAEKVSQLRAAHGKDARIKVVRDVNIPRAPQEWVKFTITQNDGTVRVTNAVPKTKAEQLARALAQDFPKATLSRQEWTA